MVRYKLRNVRSRCKALFGADGAVTAAAIGLQTAAQVAQMVQNRNATIQNANTQAQAQAHAAQVQANALAKQNTIATQNAEKQIETQKEAQAENKDIQNNYYLALQTMMGQQNQNDRLEASKIQVKNGGNPIRGKIPYSFLRGGSNTVEIEGEGNQNRPEGENLLVPLGTPFKVTDGGAVVPKEITPYGNVLYSIIGNDHNHYHKTKGGKYKTGVGIKFPKGADAKFISAHNIAGFNPVDAVNMGMSPELAFDNQEINKAINGISDDGKHDIKPPYKKNIAMCGTSLNPLAYNVGLGMPTTLVGGIGLRQSLRNGGRPQAGLGSWLQNQWNEIVDSYKRGTNPNNSAYANVMGGLANVINEGVDYGINKIIRDNAIAQYVNNSTFGNLINNGVNSVIDNINDLSDEINQRVPTDPNSKRIVDNVKSWLTSNSDINNTGALGLAMLGLIPSPKNLSNFGKLGLGIKAAEASKASNLVHLGDLITPAAEKTPTVEDYLLGSVRLRSARPLGLPSSGTVTTMPNALKERAVEQRVINNAHAAEQALADQQFGRRIKLAQADRAARDLDIAGPQVSRTFRVAPNGNVFEPTWKNTLHDKPISTLWNTFKSKAKIPFNKLADIGKDYSTWKKWGTRGILGGSGLLLGDIMLSNIANWTGGAGQRTLSDEDKAINDSIISNMLRDSAYNNKARRNKKVNGGTNWWNYYNTSTVQPANYVEQIPSTTQQQVPLNVQEQKSGIKSSGSSNAANKMIGYGALINGGLNLVGGILSDIAQNRAGKIASNAYLNAGDLLANAYSQWHGIDLGNIKKSDFDPGIAMPGLVSYVDRSAQPVTAINRQRDAYDRNARRFSLSSASALQRQGQNDINAADARGQVYNQEGQRMTEVEKINAANTTQASIANAQNRTQANQNYYGILSDAMKFNADVDNQKVTGIAQSKADAMTNAAGAIANAKINGTNSLANALSATGQSFGSAFNTIGNNIANFQNVMVGSTINSAVTTALSTKNKYLAQVLYNQLKNSNDPTYQGYVASLVNAGLLNK